MKGISAVIAVVMILVISVSLAGIFYFWISSTVSGGAVATERQVEKVTKGVLTQIKVESVSGNKIYIRNVGIYPASDFLVFIDDEPVQIINQRPVEPMRVGVIEVNSSWLMNRKEGPHTLKVVSGMSPVVKTLYLGSETYDICGTCGSGEITLRVAIAENPVWVNLSYSSSTLNNDYRLAVNGRTVDDSKEATTGIYPADMGAGSGRFYFPVPHGYFKPGENEMKFVQTSATNPVWSDVRISVYYIRRIY